jgi:uncharacterized OsmC-like protein
MSEIVKNALGKTIQGLKENPETAMTVFEAQAELGENVKVHAGARTFTFNFDEPPALGGDDSAPNPVEYVLASLGACQAIVYRALASLKGIHLESVKINTKGHLDLNGFLGLDSTVRPGLSKVEFETTIVSNETTETIERLASQVESLCPVLDIISNPVTVQGKLTVLKEAILV